MRIVLAATLLALAGCSSHDNKATTSTDPNVVLASSGAHSGCSSGAVTALAEPKVELASTTEAKSCHAPTGEMASADGAKKCSMKGEMASAEGKSCHAKGGTLASADASHQHACDGGCPTMADGSCDHEAGAKAGRQCCKDKLAKTATP